METWARLKGNTLTRTLLYQNELPPAPENLDGLVVLGGPMGVGDREGIEWMNRELRFIEKTLEAGKQVLGICLGAQMLAHVLGARVYKGRHPEIGWFPVRPIGSPSNNLLPREDFQAFHWHGDTFDLPAQSVLLAETDGTPHQAFLWEKRALALQFHLEITAPGIESLLHECASDLTPGPYVKVPSQIRAGLKRLSLCHRHFELLLDGFFGSQAP